MKLSGPCLSVRCCELWPWGCDTVWPHCLRCPRVTHTDWRDLAVAMWWQLGSGQARARDPGHWIATPLPRPAPHMIPGLRRPSPSSSSLQILFQCQTQSWILLSHPPLADICSHTSTFDRIIYRTKICACKNFKIVVLIMVDRIIPKGQIRLRMYRRTFNYGPQEPEINNVQG